MMLGLPREIRKEADETVIPVRSTSIRIKTFNKIGILTGGGCEEHAQRVEHTSALERVEELACTILFAHGLTNLAPICRKLVP